MQKQNISPVPHKEQGKDMDFQAIQADFNFSNFQNNVGVTAATIINDTKKFRTLWFLNGTFFN